MHYFAPLTPCTLLERSARSFPNKPAIIGPNGDIRFASLLDRARRLAQALARLGVGPGDRVAVLLENCPQTIEAHFAVPAAGGLIVMINPWLPAADVADLLGFCGATAVIIDAAQLAQFPFLSDRAGRSQMHLMVIDGGSFGASPETLDYEALLSRESGDAPLDRTVSSELDPIAINFTSGTTGQPKGVVYSHRAAYLHALGQIVMLDLNRRSNYLWTLPMFHVNGWGHMWACVAAGCTQIILEKRFTPETAAAFATVVAKHRVSHLAGSPRLLRALSSAAPGHGVLKGVTVLTGGAAPTEVLIRDLEAAGARLIHQYGLNETCGPFVVCEPQDDWMDLPAETRSRLLGRQGTAALHAGTGLQVVAEDGRRVPHDGQTLGEIALSGNTVAIGYYNNADATQKAFRDGWFYTGDMAVVHPDGNLEIRDRRKDLIFVETEYGWENVSSLEIENVLIGNPSIKDAAIVGIQFEKAVLVAFVELKDGADLARSDFFAYCEEHLAVYKRPPFVLFTELPKTATGKIRKDVLVANAKRLLTEVELRPCHSSADPGGNA